MSQQNQQGQVQGQQQPSPQPPPLLTNALGVRGMPVYREWTCPMFIPEDPVTNDPEKKMYALRYAPTSTKLAWCYFPAYSLLAHKYEAFCDAVLKLYHGSEQTAVYTLADYDALVGKCTRLGPVASYDEYLQHYLEALPIVTHLLSIHRISDEQARQLLTIAIPQDVLLRVEARLNTLFPNLDVTKTHMMAQFHEAVCYIMHQGTHTLRSGFALPMPAYGLPTGASSSLAPPMSTLYAPPLSAPVQAQMQGPSPAPLVKTKEAAEMFKAVLASVSELMRAISEQNSTIHKQVNTALDVRGKDKQQPAVSQMVLELDDWQERFDNEDQLDMFALEGRQTQSQMARQGGRAFFEYLLNQAAQPHSKPNATPLKLAGPTPTIEHALLAGARTRSDLDSALQDPAQHVQVQMQTAQYIDDSTTGVAVHPYAGVCDASQAKEAMDHATRYMGDLATGTLHSMGSKPREPIYKTVFPELDPDAEVCVLERVLSSSELVSLSPKELLSIAPGICHRVHDITTARWIATPSDVQTKKVAFAPEATILRHYVSMEEQQPGPPEAKAMGGVNSATHGESSTIEEAHMLNLSAAPATNVKHLLDLATMESSGSLPPGVVHLIGESARTFPGDTTESILTALSKLKICTIWTLMSASQPVKCILDRGCQFVAMSEECCLQLKLSYDPEVTLRAIAANSSFDKVLGLARNMLVTIQGRITVYLQIYIICNASYDILLV
ncbi:hypothetical protein V8D89_002042 [Ganoderma adspersum]